MRITPAVVSIFLGGAILLVAIGLWTMGALPLPGFAMGSKVPSEEGFVGVPIARTRIPAHTKLTRDHFFDRSGNLSVARLPADQVRPEMITNLRDLIGRVLERDKSPGYVFTEADLLSAGTRPGLVAGIPPGKRGMRVQADQVQGLYGLGPGDRFDLVATIPIETGKLGRGLSIGGPYKDVAMLQADLTNWMKQATVRVLVQNGVLVEPLQTRSVPVSANTLTQGAVTRMRPVQEGVIAVDPQEVALLTQAVAVKAQINVVLRSGNPEDPMESATPELQPSDPYSGIGGGLSNGEIPAGIGGIPRLSMVEMISSSRGKEQGRGFIGVPVDPRERSKTGPP